MSNDIVVIKVNIPTALQSKSRSIRDRLQGVVDAECSKIIEETTKHVTIGFGDLMAFADIQ